MGFFMVEHGGFDRLLMRESFDHLLKKQTHQGLELISNVLNTTFWMNFR